MFRPYQVSENVKLHDGKESIHMEFIYQDDSILVCVKPAGVLSTDEPGGMPELVRTALGDQNACVRTVHRLDRVVSGLMVFAHSPEAASRLSRLIRDHRFGKEYLAVAHGHPLEKSGTFTDLLQRSAKERKTYVVKQMAKGVQEAILDYRTLASNEELSLVKIRLRTGRTHQIRAQFSSRGMPLVGDKKYSLNHDDCPIALWSSRLCFTHPVTGDRMDFSLKPPAIYPWSLFQKISK
jgi:23S rRNA pseudouridine1911/1915/1917 synthase